MDTITADPIVADQLQMIARLTANARRNKIKLYFDRRDNHYYASSGSTPGKLYMVTLASCTCVGFQNHQHCQHWAALNTAILLQAGGPDPEQAAGLCPTCHGAGTVESKRSRWVGGGKLGYRSEWTLDVQCEGCGGTGDRAPMAA
jgi:hypothetical protein